MQTLTKNQNELLIILKKYMTNKDPMHYDNLKKLSEFKTFETSFNALLHKKYIKRFNLGNGVNNYILNN